MQLEDILMGECAEIEERNWLFLITSLHQEQP
jgi:hypothetical protein